MKLRIKYKLGETAEYYCSLTDELNKYLKTKCKAFKVYVCNFDERYLAIRIPGCTIGCIEKDKNNKILDIQIYENYVSNFNKDVNKDVCKSFVGSSIEY